MSFIFFPYLCIEHFWLIEHDQKEKFWRFFEDLSSSANIEDFGNIA